MVAISYETTGWSQGPAQRHDLIRLVPFPQSVSSTGFVSSLEKFSSSDRAANETINVAVQIVVDNKDKSEIGLNDFSQPASLAHGARIGKLVGLYRASFERSQPESTYKAPAFFSSAAAWKIETLPIRIDSGPFVCDKDPVTTPRCQGSPRHLVGRLFPRPRLDQTNNIVGVPTVALFATFVTKLIVW
tara:strand:+ start:594 stop:1157 length:564 start_codon:yes stop_codon:yes gene_type:complete